MTIVDPIWQQINQAIHGRDTEAVGQLIPKYLKAHRSSPEALYEASEFYRKIRDYKNALRMLPKERKQVPLSHVTDAETKLELQLARLLNLLGASNYALRMVDRIRAEDRAKSKIEMVEIYHCNCKYAEVVALLGADYPIPDSEPWHQDWLLHIYLAQASGELGQVDLAIKRVERMQSLSSSPLIQAIALCLKGKYLLMAGDTKRALPALLESRQFFQAKDQTADHGILQMCLGQCYFKLRNFSEAEKALETALKIFHQPALMPEDWMEVVLMLEQIPGYQRPDLRLAPRLWAMYGPDYSPLRLVKTFEPEEKSQIFSVSKIEPKRKKIHLDRESDIAWTGKKARLGLDLVDQMIYSLLYAGGYGLPQFRVYELLWPDEPFSFDEHQKRLEQVVMRARDQGYKIIWKDLHLWLKSKDVSATSRPENVIRGRSFLLENPVFTRRDLENYFSISKATAQRLCLYWLKKRLVAAEKSLRYRVC